ncbi:MAG: FMN-binding protein [Planctomyces sp.]|nr:FMN-binding protein [Planctomyces sp.]
MRPLLLVLGMFITESISYADQIELSSGMILEGTITSREGSSVTAEVMVGNRTVKRTFPKNRIKSITIDGRRMDPNTGAVIGAPSDSGSGKVDRSDADIIREIDTKGSDPPAWLEKTTPDFPKSLDMKWPQPNGEGWDSSKNIGQYVWDRIHPNPGQWRNGVVLMHQVMAVNPDPAVQERAKRTLGNMYHNLHEDYLRAAYWYRQSGIEKNPRSEPQAIVHLADCYWKLGSRSLALKTLNDSPVKPYIAIKLLGDLGETEAALKMAEQFSRTGEASTSCLYAGDACRVAGRLDEAKQWYRKAIDSIKPDEAEKPHRIRDRARAEASLQAIDFYILKPADVQDGTYEAESIGYEGQVHIEVKVRSGRIEHVQVTKHQEKQFYSSINDTTTRIVQRQSINGIDATSGATITSEAIINATAKALASGKKE